MLGSMWVAGIFGRGGWVVCEEWRMMGLAGACGIGKVYEKQYSAVRPGRFSKFCRGFLGLGYTISEMGRF